MFFPNNDFQKQVMMFREIDYNLIALLGLLLMSPTIFAQQFENVNNKRQQGFESLPQPLFKVAQLYQEKGQLSKATLKKYDIASRQDGEVYIELKHGFELGNEVNLNDQTLSYFEPQHEYKNVIGGWVAQEDIFELSKVLPADYLMLSPNPGVVDTNGVAVTNSTSYIANVNGGQGLKVGIIDLGFGGVYSSQAQGNVPTPFYEHDHSGSGDPFDDGNVHGTGCTEVIYNFAPAAEFHLFKVQGHASLGLAIQDAISTGIDIISISLSYFNTGWDDGSGAICSAVKDATDAGIIVFCSSGNDNLKHWQGDFRDVWDGDGLHEWNFGIDEGNDVLIENEKELKANLQWEGNPTVTNDFNIIFFNTITGVEISSTTNNTGYDALTWENDTGSDLLVSISIEKVASNKDEFELWVSEEIEYNQTGGSTKSPANTAEDLLVAVGAVDRTDYNTSNPSPASYSSRGPSNDGRKLPDIVAPTNLKVYSYPDGMGGTSSATPCAAGIALLLWSEHDYLSPEGLLDLLFGFVRLYNPWSVGLHDNDFGRGGIELPNFTANSRFIIEGVTNNNDLDRPFDKIERADFVSPADQNIFFLGGDYDIPNAASRVIDKEMIYRSLKNDATIKVN